MEAAWIGEALVLGRRVRVGRATFLQGCWLDWDAIRSELLGVTDLAPERQPRAGPRSDDRAPTSASPPCPPAW